MGRKRKKKIVENLLITGLADKGKGMGRDAEGRVIFTEGCVAPGDVVDVLIKKRRSAFWQGFVIAFRQMSEERVQPFCKHFDSCGGCTYQHLPYEAQLRYKEERVRDILRRIGKIEPGEFLPILPAEPNVFYRNKMEYAFSNRRWLTAEELAQPEISNREDVLGFHRAGAFDKIVPIEECWLQEDPSNEIRNFMGELARQQELPFFDLREGSGMMRHLLIRIASTGEIMLIVSFFEKDMQAIRCYLDAVLRRFPQITTLAYCINPKANDYILDLDMHIYHGKGYIEEKLGDLRFKIQPKSFFQTNTRQAVRLYDRIIEFAGLNGSQTVYDLYTGVGSIALYVARAAKKVIGIEEIPDAITDAIENARINKIENCSFYAGDVRKVLSKTFAERHGKADLVITDPPRAGMHQDVVDFLLQLRAPKIVYVSCNPATQARDLQLLSEAYQVEKIQPVDMFPHTYHVETIALLRLKTQNE